MLTTTRLLFTALAVMISVASAGQSSSKRLLGSFIHKQKAYNYEFAMAAHDNYSFNISSIAVVSAASQNADSSLFSEFSQQIFEKIFISQMAAKYQLTDDDVKRVATEVFFKIKTKLDFLDDEPVTAFMILKKDIIWSVIRGNSSSHYKGVLSEALLRHKIHRVEGEIADGALKNISVYLVDSAAGSNVSPRQFLLFKNQLPISISGKFDYEKSSKVNLYCFNCNGVDGLSRYIRLSDLVILDIIYENDKEDYSPANTTFSLSPNSPIVEMRKERRSRVLEVAAFSDFIGLDRDEPNGLIQVEAKRRININTKHWLLIRNKSSDRILNAVADRQVNVDVYRKSENATTYQIGGDTIRVKPIRAGFKSVYFSIFNYVEPKLLFSKLDENNRLLDSAKAPNNLVDPITLYQYQIASFGARLQLFKLSFPQIKLQLNVLDIGAFWSRTRVASTADSTGPSEALNSNYWQFGTSVIFRPDNRWGASVGFEYLKPRIWNDNYELTNKKGMFQQQFDVWLRTGYEDKLFFRYRWTYENQNRNRNFTQIQLGYSLNLFVGNNVGQTEKRP